MPGALQLCYCFQSQFRECAYGKQVLQVKGAALERDRGHEVLCYVVGDVDVARQEIDIAEATPNKKGVISSWFPSCTRLRQGKIIHIYWRAGRLSGIELLISTCCSW